MSAMFIFNQRWKAVCCFVLIFFLSLVPQASWAEEFTVLLPGGVPMTLIKVPAGTFQMGSPEGERGNILGNEKEHQVTLTRDYYLGKTEITDCQWSAVMGTRPISCGSTYYDPVSGVSWDQIAGPGGFVEKLNQYLETTEFRLPTEAEWERAARAGTTTRFAHGDALECSDECEYCEEHRLHMFYCGIAAWTCIEVDPDNLNQCVRFIALPHVWEVGLTQPNPFGLHDMHGNVWEWVQDRYGDYSPGDVTDPTGPEAGTDRVVRGGSWAGEARLSRSASRFGADPESSGIPANTEIEIGPDGFGFRIAISSVENLGIQINAGLNDAWYNPTTNGQGFLITVFPEIKQMFLAWFTFDTERPPEIVTSMLGEPGHRWLTAQGPYEGNAAVLHLYNTVGGVFDSPEPAPLSEEIGEIYIQFSSCNSGIVAYDLPDLGLQGEVNIERIALDNNALCEILSGQ